MSPLLAASIGFLVGVYFGLILIAMLTLTKRRPPRF